MENEARDLGLMDQDDAVAEVGLGDQAKQEDGTCEESQKQVKSETSAQLYDMVFWTSANQLLRYVPALVNEAFGEHYTEKAIVTLKAGKQVTERPENGLVWREGDAFINLAENARQADYHFECETDGRNTVALRVVEYASGYAAQSASMIQDGAVIRIPHSAVIFLRSDSSKAKKLTMWIEYPGGKVSYDVPVIKMRDYTLETLFEKHLIVLAPFVPFIFSEKDYASMEENGTEQLKKMINDFCKRLDEMVEKKELEPWERGNLLRYTMDVLSKRTTKYKKVKKEAEETMGGRLIKTDIDIAMEKTREETEDKMRMMSIQSLIETRGFSIKEAMDSLKIPLNKQSAYAKLLEQSNVVYDAQ